MPSSFVAAALPTLMQLSPIDLIIIVFYFVFVLTIAVYLKRRARNSSSLTAR